VALDTILEGLTLIVITTVGGAVLTHLRPIVIALRSLPKMVEQVARHDAAIDALLGDNEDKLDYVRREWRRGRRDASKPSGRGWDGKDA